MSPYSLVSQPLGRSPAGPLPLPLHPEPTPLWSRSPAPPPALGPALPLPSSAPPSSPPSSAPPLLLSQVLIFQTRKDGSLPPHVHYKIRRIQASRRKPTRSAGPTGRGPTPTAASTFYIWPVWIQGEGVDLGAVEGVREGVRGGGALTSADHHPVAPPTRRHDGARHHRHARGPRRGGARQLRADVSLPPATRGASECRRSAGRALGPRSTGLRLTPLPPPSFLFVIEHMMPLCMVISWVYSVAMTHFKHIVAEREHQLGRWEEG